MIKRFLCDLCSPRGLSLRALALAGFFAVCHLLQWRVHTSFLSGTLEAEGVMRGLAPLFGLIYIFAYLLAVVVAPVLLIAAGLLVAWSRVRG